MKDLIFHAPLNDTSIGNVSVAFLRELYNRDLNISLFPVSDVINLDVYDDLDDGFISWVNQCFSNRFKSLSKDAPSLQVWHIRGSEKRISKNNFLYTFHETSKPTLSEINICKIHNKVFFSSEFSSNLFKCAGLDNCSSIPIGFDKCFYKTHRNFSNKVKHFSLMGKFEKRKNTGNILRNWASRFGNDPNYQLSCLIVNRFIDSNKLNNLIGESLNGKVYSNINFLPFMEKNSEVNTILNSIDIDLTGLSGGEGWNLPAFNATCLGKWSCVSNCTSHKDWATKDNCILVEPDGTFNVDDGIFFQDGSEFNQGEFNSISDKLMISSFEEALIKSNNTNFEGEKLKAKFTYEKTVESILNSI